MKPESNIRVLRESNGYGALAGIVACFICLFICLSLAPVLIQPSARERGPGPQRQAEEGAGVYCHVEVQAPLPYLKCDSALSRFERLRREVAAGAGFDFLAVCGDLLRDHTTQSSKPGVADNSKHKSGEAFDYNQEDGRVLIVREPAGGRTYWRTYLLCEKQDGGCGAKLDLQTENAGRVSAYLFDFTAAAESLGWQRVPAQEGWGRVATKKEFWHYELREGLKEAVGDRAAAERKKGPSVLAAPLLYLADRLSPRKPAS